MADDSTDDLLDKLGRGEIEAAEALFDRYAPFLRAVVRGQLSDPLRAKLDSTDVVQSVWVQVVRQLGRNGWQVNDEAHLRALLATIARRRLVTRVRQYARLVGEPEGGELDALPDIRHPRPSEVVQADDLWLRMLDLCPPDHHPVLELRRAGVPLAEIAERTGLHEGSVRRILRRLSRELALTDAPVAPDPLTVTPTE
jgi:RNA polymerase sigma-70 factor (ECF subfamily)